MRSRASIMQCLGMVLATALALSACVTARAPSAAGALPPEGPVSVSWRDPAGFSEPTFGVAPIDRGRWIVPLARHVRQRTMLRLPPGHRLQVELLDVDRAGEYEPRAGANPDLRVIRDVYPPRIHLRFRHVDGAGGLVAEGERRLTDVAFLHRSSTLDTDPLRFEKQLLDDWLRRELGTR